MTQGRTAPHPWVWKEGWSIVYKTWTMGDLEPATTAGK